MHAESKPLLLELGLHGRSRDRVIKQTTIEQYPVGRGKELSISRVWSGKCSAFPESAARGAANVQAFRLIEVSTSGNLFFEALD